MMPNYIFLGSLKALSFNHLKNTPNMPFRVVLSFLDYRKVIKEDNTSSVPFAGKVGEALEALSPVFKKHKNLWVKGGVAREVLRKHITGRTKESPRDLDLVLIGSEDPDLERELRELSEKSEVFSQATEGYHNFGGIDTERSFESYMRFRDLTINEVLYRPGKIVYTLRASRDIADGIVRATPYEFERGEGITDDKGLLGDRAALRVILTAVREGKKIASGTERALAESIKYRGLDPFHVVVHLFRAIEIGVASEFAEKLSYYGYNGDRDPYTLLVNVLVSLNRQRWDVFELRGREGDVKDAIDQGIQDSRVVEELLKFYPEIKAEVDKVVPEDFDDYEEFLSNRDKKLDRRSRKAQDIGIR